MGLVTEVWPLAEPFDRAHSLALERAEMPAEAVRGVLGCIVGAGDKPLAEGVAAERRAVLETIRTANQREGMRAFLEKRRPRFKRESS
ncbi:MAG: hypothetical protein D6760_04370 [Deltaproteobacteria bacterium]|nr:MAG: hypothetical protein D6760_04370 [Deltaproteobacteria bacterium]